MHLTGVVVGIFSRTSKARFPGLVGTNFGLPLEHTMREILILLWLLLKTHTETHAYLAKLGVHTCARHGFDGRVRSDHLPNNLAESFNNWIGHRRAKSILTMLEGIKCKIMTWIQKRYQKGVSWTHGITANFNKQTLSIARIARFSIVELWRGGVYGKRRGG